MLIQGSETGNGHAIRSLENVCPDELAADDRQGPVQPAPKQCHEWSKHEGQDHDENDHNQGTGDVPEQLEDHDANH